MSRIYFMNLKKLIAGLALLLAPLPLLGQEQQARRPANLESIMDRLETIERMLEGHRFTNQSLAKRIDDLMWYIFLKQL